MRLQKILLVLFALLALSSVPPLSEPLRAEENLVTFKSMSIDLALSLARAALTDCQKHGYQVTVAVVDRFGVPQVLLRDRFAGAHTVPTATGKAWTAVSFRSDTSDLVSATGPGSPQAGVRALPGVTIIAGGVMVEAAGSLVGAVGVSGAPGGDNDEACAKAGIAAVRDKLDF
ncbi:MAG: GlcG/HbpS family heme-binding protein [Pseudolabrys sp.]